MSDLSLKGKVVVVTGGSGGIGFETVRLLAEEGADVAFFYCKTAIDLSNFEDKLKEGHGLIKQYKVDVRNKIEIITALKMIEEEFGGIDHLVNSAGITKDGFMLLMDDKNFDMVLDVNLKGCFLTSQAVLPYLLNSRENASIVNVTSVSGLKGVIGQTNYCSSKAGLIGLTKSLAREMAHKNIRVNAVAPGYIETHMINEIPEKEFKQIKRNIPMRRTGKASEVAKVIKFLLSDDASYITGETIVVDGGVLA